jgi:hypothetical protein
VTPVAPDAPVETKPLVEAKPVWGDAKKGGGQGRHLRGLPTAWNGNPTDPQYRALAACRSATSRTSSSSSRTNQRTGGMAAVMKPFADALSAQDMARPRCAHFANAEGRLRRRRRTPSSPTARTRA